MNSDEKLVLAAWARGVGGVSPRLAKRAWLVLAHQERQSPTGLAKTWSNASDAQRWVKSFYAMGLTGLVDAPRAGRPSSHVYAVAAATKKIDKLHADGIGTASVVADTVLQPLTKQEKEALWRSMRQTGRNPVRNRNGLDLPLSVTGGLSDLVCLLLTPNLKLLAFMPESSRHWDSQHGLWIGVPEAKLAGDTKSGGFKNLLSALRLDVTRARRATQRASSGQLDRQDDLLIKRVARHLDLVATSFPGMLDVAVFTDLKAPAPLMLLLQRMRESRLWQSVAEGHPGKLKSARHVPFRTSWATAAQFAIGAHLSNAPAEVIAEFQDVLSLKRRGSFCWLKSMDEAGGDGTYGWSQVEDPIDGVYDEDE
jgi:hypothetical protein